MRKLFIISLLALSGCTTMTPDQKAMQQASDNFVYVSDIADEWRIYDRIDQPFEGDCEDYALTLQKQIGGKVWYVNHHKRGAHAVLVKNNVTYDFLVKRPLHKYLYPGEFVFVMN
jgi:outer membrane biogenesis lipoprotein LolB